ncbi:MAG: hypothetical protein C0625_14470 [Arcobacter sp.]|nr:MAG: hypothetical protein C0625_14470 [Arcobacter sp.]
MSNMNCNLPMQKYFLIDKVIINENEEFYFDIYGKNLKEERVSLISTKGQPLTKERVQNLISNKLLYVHEEEKLFYDEYYINYMKQKITPENMENFYKSIGDTINRMFEDPESLGNVKKVKEVVKNIISTILHVEFTVSSFISILSHDYLYTYSFS